MDTTELQDRFTLWTNISTVTIGGVRTFTHALLLSEGEHPLVRGQPHVTLRGFGTEASASTFDYGLPTAEHAVGVPSAGSKVMMLSGDALVPLTMAVVLRFNGGGPDVVLGIEDRARPLDVQRWEGAQSDRRILDVWPVLERKVAEYWTAPRMPRLEWVSPIRARWGR